MKRFLINASIIAFAGILPLGVIFIIGANQPAKYQDSFYGGLSIKDQRLYNIKEKNKIVFIGGSSLSFGLRSDMMSEALGYEVVDYGLYAPLGTKTMSELAKKAIGKGDVVVFAPELNAETYSTRVNANMFLKCAEKKPGMLTRFSLDDQAEILANLPYFYSERAVASVEATAPYDRNSFNDYGDIESDLVVNNVLPEFFDSSQLIAPEATLINKDFVSYLNSYASNMKKQGAKVYFTFSPTNALSLVGERVDEFEAKLTQALDFKVLGSVKGLTYHQNYFYDTNFHLNYAGTILHSKNLTDILAAELNIETHYEFPEVEMPKAKYEKDDDPVDPTPSEDSFVLEKLGDEYFLSSVSESLKEKEVIVVPDSLGDKVIKGVSRDAFKGFANTKIIILPSSVENLSNGIFNGCSSLERIYLRNETAPSVVGQGLLEGCNESAKIYILRSARKSYTTGYTWVDYLDYFMLYDLGDIEEYLQ